MKRLRRIILNVLTALSLLLCVATVALWVRSYQRMERLEWCASYDFSRGDAGPIWSHERNLYATGGRLRAESLYNVWGGMFSGFLNPSHPWSLDELPTERLSSIRVSRETHHSLQFAGFELVFPRIQVNSQARTDNFSRTEFRQYVLTLPMWALVLVLSLLPLRAAIPVLRRRESVPSGLCPTCRYDLTGNDSGICPECGKPIVKLENAHV